MPTYRDSVGNVYRKHPGSGLDKNQPHTAKKTKSNREGRRGRNKAKYDRYRMRRGKPRGPGVPGNKSGANKGK